jgi:hypothetical protein
MNCDNPQILQKVNLDRCERNTWLVHAAVSAKLPVAQRPRGEWPAPVPAKTPPADGGDLPRAPLLPKEGTRMPVAMELPCA